MGCVGQGLLTACMHSPMPITQLSGGSNATKTHGVDQVPPFKATLMEAMPYIDFLFGNETEARAFAESEGWTTTDVAEIALKVTHLSAFS